MIEKIGTNQIPDYMGKVACKHNPEARVQSCDAEAMLQSDFTSLVDKAARGDDSDLSAVENAKKLLQSGQLETAENIMAAAENILKLGI